MTTDNGPHDAGTIALTIDDWVFGHTLTEEQYARIKECVSPMVSELDRLSARVAELEGAIKRSAFDVSPCMTCDEPTVCLPDGMPMCDSCAAKEARHD